MKTNEAHEIQEAQNVTNAFPGAETAVGIAQEKDLFCIAVIQDTFV